MSPASAAATLLVTKKQLLLSGQATLSPRFWDSKQGKLW
jgi:hypothetical protein